MTTYEYIEKEYGEIPSLVYQVIEKKCEEKGVLLKGHLFVRLGIKEISAEIPCVGIESIHKAVSKLTKNNLMESIKFHCYLEKFRRVKSFRGKDGQTYGPK